MNNFDQIDGYECTKAQKRRADRKLYDANQPVPSASNENSTASSQRTHIELPNSEETLASYLESDQNTEPTKSAVDNQGIQQILAACHYGKQ